MYIVKDSFLSKFGKKEANWNYIMQPFVLNFD